MTIQIILPLIAVIAAALLLYSCAMEKAIRRSDARADRDPITGVIRGLEAITIPPSAPKSSSPVSDLEARTSDSPSSSTSNLKPQTSNLSPSPACLLIHGFVGSRRDFADLGEYLANRGFTVRMMRIPGHGTSPVDFGYQSPSALLKAVHQEYLDLRRTHDRVYLVGFSMGGSLATILASQEKPDALVLVAPYFGVNYRWYYLLPAEKWNALGRPFVHYVIKPDWAIRVNDRSVVHQIFTYDYIPTAGAKQLIDLGLQAKSPEVLKNITCPVLVIHSSGDAAASYTQSRTAYDLIRSPKKESLWFTRSNHHILWDYDRNQAKQRIGDFLAKQETAAHESPSNSEKN